MKLTFSRETLLKPLQVISGVVEKRQTSPILSNLLMQVNAGQLSMTGTDLEVQMFASIAIETDGDGDFTIPARKFVDICKSLPENAQIQLHVDNDKAIIKSGRSRFSLSTLPANEYPSLDNIETNFSFEVPQNQLKRLIEQTQFSMAQQDVRYYLNGMLFEISNTGLNTVATDGHRLAICHQDLDINITETRQIIIPRKGVLEIARLLDDSSVPVAITLSSNHVRIKLPEVSFTSKLIDGKFPDYQQVIPRVDGTKIVCSRSLLHQAFSRASILSNEKYRGMRISFSENLLRATVHNPEQEEAEEEIEVSYHGDEFEIGFNVSYLLDALNAVKSDDAELYFTDSNHSCLICGVGDVHSRYVVMPMRL
ncbi:MAG: DNA polymerase III subunit beta [Gammaproteobacteria bacterium]